MSLPPSVVAALTEPDRRDLLTRAETHRLAHAARSNRPAPAHYALALTKTTQPKAAAVTAFVIIAVALTAILALTAPGHGLAPHNVVTASQGWGGGGSGGGGGGGGS
jgi:hypothetical protein